jgi:ferredoxin
MGHLGHLGNLKDEYRDLIHRLEAGPVSMPVPDQAQAQAGLREILEILYTPEEAALAARLPVMPSTISIISDRVGLPVDDLLPRLDVLADKGVVMDMVNPKTGETRYVLAPPVVGFFEFSMMRIEDSIPKRRMAEALDAYTHGDPTFANEVFGHETKVGRTLVHETAIDEEVMPEVLDWEKATAVLAEAKSISLSICYCRHKAEHLEEECDAPQETCLSLNGAAEYISRRNFGRTIEHAEALDILVECRESGLVQLADNVQKRPAYVCNCCGCCCGQLSAINEFDLQAVVPSGFEAASTPDLCNGCSRCSRACPIGAVTMIPQRVARKRKNTLVPVVDADRCIGCGVCVGACKRDAMHMEARAKRAHVPENGIERTVRQMLERGRLAHLVADEGASRGSRFLNHVLQAVCALPVAEQIVASEQLKSRFVASLLSRTRSSAPRPAAD